MSVKTPEAWSLGAAIKAKVELQSKANLEMGAEVAGIGLCPDCKTPMERVMHGANEVAICVADRIVLPLKDREDVAGTDTNQSVNP